MLIDNTVLYHAAENILYTNSVLLFQMFFFKRLAKVLVQLICISVAIYARPDKDSSLNNGIKEDTTVDSADITRSNYILLKSIPNNRHLSKIYS